MQSTSEKQQAFLEVYPVMFDRVYRYVVRRTPQVEEAKDLVADIMIRAFERLPQFDAEKGSYEQWIIGMAKFALIDYWRRGERCVLIEGDVTQEENIMNRIDDELSFEHRIASLPNEHKILLRLRYVDDMSLLTIAEMTHTNPSTLRSFFSRTHKRLRTIIDEQTYE